MELGESREIQMIPGLGVIPVGIVQVHVTDQVDVLCDQNLIRARLVGAIMKIEHAADAWMTHGIDDRFGFGHQIDDIGLIRRQRFQQNGGLALRRVRGNGSQFLAQDGHRLLSALTGPGTPLLRRAKYQVSAAEFGCSVDKATQVVPGFPAERLVRGGDMQALRLGK